MSFDASIAAGAIVATGNPLDEPEESARFLRYPSVGMSGGKAVIMKSHLNAGCRCVNSDSGSSNDSIRADSSRILSGRTIKIAFSASVASDSWYACIRDLRDLIEAGVQAQS